MRKVVVNTTPLIALSHVGQLDILYYKGIFLKENFREVSFFYYGQSSLCIFLMRRIARDF